MLLDKLRTAITTSCVDTLGVSWDERFGELQAYKNEFKDCDVPARYSKNRKLGTWVVAQRQAKKFGQLSERQIKLLDGIGFGWQLQTEWEDMLEKLVAFKQKNNHCNVPQKFQEDPDLGIWVLRQRLRHKAGTLDIERRQKLETHGFAWKAGGTPWETLFRDLAEYKRKNGHCNVSVKENGKLARWITAQRRAKQNMELNAAKIDRLKSIGFAWHAPIVIQGSGGEVRRLEMAHGKWSFMFNQLLQFRQQRGDCNVPSGWKENPQLANWVTVQRRAKRLGRKTITQEQIRKLDEIGFVWDHDRSKLTWDEMFSFLQEYKRRHGDCKVLAKWPDNPKLASWVSNQRSAKKAGKLSEEKIQRLTEVGFQWVIQKHPHVGKCP
jgi:hypothetical protein